MEKLNYLWIVSICHRASWHYSRDILRQITGTRWTVQSTAPTPWGTEGVRAPWMVQSAVRQSTAKHNIKFIYFLPCFVRSYLKEWRASFSDSVAASAAFHIVIWNQQNLKPRQIWHFLTPSPCNTTLTNLWPPKVCRKSLTPRPRLSEIS